MTEKLPPLDSNEMLGCGVGENIIPIGTRFERLEVIAAPILCKTGNQRKRFYSCVCDCGTVENACVDTLRRGSAKECKACGLLRRKRIHKKICAAAFISRNSEAAQRLTSDASNNYERRKVTG